MLPAATAVSNSRKAWQDTPARTRSAFVFSGCRRMTKFTLDLEDRVDTMLAGEQPLPCDGGWRVCFEPCSLQGSPPAAESEGWRLMARPPATVRELAQSREARVLRSSKHAADLDACRPKALDYLFIAEARRWPCFRVTAECSEPSSTRILVPDIAHDLCWNRKSLRNLVRSRARAE